MELSNNLIGVQGVLVKCAKQTGDFTKINYRGGNEHHIDYIIKELTSFLTSKHFLGEEKMTSTNIKDLNNIIFFLALNTEFKRQLPSLEEHSHLMNIIPQLSKCLLANICVSLGLVGSYGFIIENFPLEATEELLDQMIDCLRRGKLDKQLHNTFIILKSVVNKLSLVKLSYKTEDTVDDIVQISTIILQNLTTVATDQAQSMKSQEIYQHMGFILFQLFDLMLYTDENNQTLTKFLACLVLTTCNIIKCVTLNVFCSWAELNYEDQPLQAVIAGKAYLVMEKFQKNKVASELVSMLSTIARKPKSIAERILEADIPTMIKMVYEKDEHQKLWFRALLNTPVFSDPKILRCVIRWWQLCDEGALDRLLTLPTPKEPEQRQLILKCASNLNTAGLTKVLIAYFHREKFTWAEDVTDQLVLLFNQTHGDITEDEKKHILLLILQNARAFFKCFYQTAFKRSPELIQIFYLTKEISEIEHIGLEMLMEILNENVPTIQNVSNYTQLFDTMIASQYCTWNFIVSNVILPLANKYKSEACHLENFNFCLQILKHFQCLRCDLSSEIRLLEYVLMCASEYRCKTFLEFESIKGEITSCCVDFILHKCHDLRTVEGRRESFSSIGNNIDDPWSNYYKNLFLADEDLSLVEWVLPNFDLSNYKEGEVDAHFTRLLKILPQCVPAEWNLLLSEIATKYQYSTLLNALSDVIILLCDFTENQIKSDSEGNKRFLSPLKFCLQNYGTFLLSIQSSTRDQVLAINSLCLVLKHIPDPLKPTEGMFLINALPEEALKSLAEDKEFIARIILINDKHLCKALAQKVLASAKCDER